MSLKMKGAGLKADGLVGSRTPHGEYGWCLEWAVVVVYGLKGPWRFVNAYGIRTSNRWAINYWYAAKKYGKVVQTSDPSRIPEGAMTFSKGRSKYGHVFIMQKHTLGTGTDYPTPLRIGRFTVPNLMNAWGHKLLGYIEVTGDGVDLRNAFSQKDPASYYVGAEGDHVLWMGQRLIAHGVQKAMRYTATRTFTAKDSAALAWFQRQQGWTGGGADGQMGYQTLERLAADPK